MKMTLLLSMLLATPALAANFPTDPEKLNWKCHESAAKSPLVLQYKKIRKEGEAVTVLYGESCLCKGCKNEVDINVFEWAYGIRVLDTSPDMKKHQIEFFYGPGVNAMKNTPRGVLKAQAFASKDEWVSFSPAPFDDIHDKLEARVHRR